MAIFLVAFIAFHLVVQRIAEAAAFSADFSKVIIHHIGDDSAEPGAEVSRIAQVAQLIPSVDTDLLREIVCIGLVVCPVGNLSFDEGSVLFHQVVKGLRIMLLAGDNQFEFGHLFVL